MKTSNKQSLRFWLIIPILLTALVWGTGCTMFAHHHADPMAGWKEVYTSNPDKVISDDYHAYIDKLSPKERNGLMPTLYFENGNGQHAVAIEIGIDGIWEGTYWRHVLIYDKENKRIKVIKYKDGHYSL
jgi:hypothetical protein